MSYKNICLSDVVKSEIKKVLFIYKWSLNENDYVVVYTTIKNKKYSICCHKDDFHLVGVNNNLFLDRLINLN